MPFSKIYRFLCRQLTIELWVIAVSFPYQITRLFYFNGHTSCLLVNPLLDIKLAF